jgi:malonyl CoA-acyl carrier protein transacylase
MHDAEARVFIEIGPGTTLSGMIQRTVPATTCNIEDVASRDAAVSILTGQQVG